MSERTEGDEMCLLCGEPMAEHLKSPADWRTVPGCTGLFRKPSGTTGPADSKEMQPGWLDRQFANAAQDVGEMPKWLRSREAHNALLSADLQPDELRKRLADESRTEPCVAGPADAPKHYCTGDGCRACLDALDVPVAGPADAPKQPEVLLRYCQPEADLHVFGLRCLCGDVTRVEPPRQPHDKWPWDNQPSTECAGPVDCPECASTGSGMVAGPADAPAEETQKMSDCNGNTASGDSQGQSPVAPSDNA